MTTDPQLATQDLSIEGPGLDVDRLRPRLAAALQAAVDSLQFALIEGGRSNLTYRVTDGQRSWILRRPPLGHVLATAHDMSREYRVMDALHTTGFPVPRMVLQEPDPGLIGAPFFVMEMVHGPVITNAAQARALPATVAADAATDLIDTLVLLHSIDYEPAGLVSLPLSRGPFRVENRAVVARRRRCSLVV